MTEEYKYQLIKKLVETAGNRKNAALKLNCTIRHVNRMIQGYKAKGKTFFIHGNRGRQPVHTLSLEIKQDISENFKGDI